MANRKRREDTKAKRKKKKPARKRKEIRANKTCIIMASTNKTKSVLLHASQLQLIRPRKKKTQPLNQRRITDISHTQTYTKYLFSLLIIARKQYLLAHRRTAAPSTSSSSRSRPLPMEKEKKLDSQQNTGPSIRVAERRERENRLNRAKYLSQSKMYLSIPIPELG
jgi:hypothetical protein